MEADITLRISHEIPPSYFELCEKVDDQLVLKYVGKIEALVDSFIAVGIIRDIRVKEGNIYIVINEMDKDKFLS